MLARFACAVFVLALPSAALAVDPTGTTATFTVTQQTKVPGETLKPGDYTNPHRGITFPTG